MIPELFGAKISLGSNQITERSPFQPQQDQRRSLDAIVILGMPFDGDGEPTLRMRSRLLHTLELIKIAPGAILIPSGGLTGFALPFETEAQQIERWLRSRTCRPILREEFARESVGNIGLSYLAFLEPMGVQHVVFVTDEVHAPRVRRLATHILGNRIDATVSPAPWPLSYEEKLLEFEREARGASFVDQIIDETDAGYPEEAIAWVHLHHRAHPYLWDLDEIVAVLRGQMTNTAIKLWLGKRQKGSLGDSSSARFDSKSIIGYPHKHVMW